MYLLIDKYPRIKQAFIDIAYEEKAINRTEYNTLRLTQSILPNYNPANLSRLENFLASLSEYGMEVFIRGEEEIRLSLLNQAPLTQTGHVTDILDDFYEVLGCT